MQGGGGGAMEVYTGYEMPEGDDGEEDVDEAAGKVPPSTRNSTRQTLRSDLRTPNHESNTQNPRT